MSRVAVTGGSGFLGRHLIRALVARGDSVRALVRSEEAQVTVEALGATGVRGDLHDPLSLARAVEGCSHVVHAAALTTHGVSREEMHRANVVGTHELVAAAKRAGTVRRFLFIGAAASIVGPKEVHHADETWPLHELSYFPYAATKTRADEAVRAASHGDFQAFVLRPGWIWGRGDAHLAGMLEAARAGKMTWIDHGAHLLVTSHLANVVHGALLALDRARGGEAYFVFDDDEIQSREWVTRLLAAHGLEAPTRSIPYGVAFTLASAMDVASRVTGRRFPISRAFVRLTGREFTVRDAKARRELGYRAVVSRAQGLAELAKAHQGEQQTAGSRTASSSRHAYEPASLAGERPKD